MRTFLQLVNDVLRDLREDEVATWNATTYSTMIGGFVNSIKRDAEAAWPWSMLRSDISVTTVAGTSTYTLSGTDERSRIIDAWNDTRNCELEPYTGPHARYLQYGPTQAQGVVTAYRAAGLSSGVRQVKVFPTPSGEETLYFHCYVPIADLSADADEITIPHRPIVEGAVARARYERGEDGGVSFGDQAAFMARALSDAIALDSGHVADELIWTPA